MLRVYNFTSFHAVFLKPRNESDPGYGVTLFETLARLKIGSPVRAFDSNRLHAHPAFAGFLLKVAAQAFIHGSPRAAKLLSLGSPSGSG